MGGKRIDKKRKKECHILCMCTTILCAVSVEKCEKIAEYLYVLSRVSCYPSLYTYYVQGDSE